VTGEAPVRIERIAAGGDGVGHLADGRTIFIPRTAPGDLVEPVMVRLHARFARGRLGRLLEAGPDRVEPPCVHYVADECGGCQLQHLSAPAQRAARRRIVGDAFRRIARLEGDDPELVSSDAEWNYRTRITLSVTAGNRRIGFHPLEKPGAVFDLRRCEIATQALNATLPALRQARHHLPPALIGVRLRVGRDGQLHLVLRGPARPTAESLRRLSAALRQDDRSVAIWWRPKPGVTRLLEGPEGATPAGSFEQVHPAMGDRVRAHAVELLGELHGRRIWDLYAGLGETDSMLADHGALVDSVEVDREAVAAAERETPRPEIRRHIGRVEDWIGRLERPDKLVANPPRSGLGRIVTDGILAAGPATIVYVSCDPATLARDLAALVGPGESPARYRVTAVRAFDLFPQTAHVETVVRLEQR
jgi:23S rRNA (uracil1939-C5)-methyltransferase